MEKPLISFVVIAFQQADIIAETIEAAFAQDYEPLEIVISDDASTDDTFEIAQRMAADYTGPHRLVLNRNPVNLGIAGNIDKATDLASGEFIVGCAGDDIPLPRRVRQFANAWIESGRHAHVIHANCIMLDADGKHVGVARPPAPMQSAPTPQMIAESYLYVIGADMGWSKHLYDVFGPVSQYALIEDHVLPFRAALIGELVYLDQELVLKRPGGVANLAIPESGHDQTFGQNLREMPWRIADYRQFEADLNKVDCPGKTQLLSRIRRKQDLLAFEYRIGKARLGGRLASVPGAAMRAVRRRDMRYLKRALLYAGAPLSIWALDLRRNMQKKRAGREARL